VRPVRDDSGSLQCSKDKVKAGLDEP
jgi:hypothetical protein